MNTFLRCILPLCLALSTAAGRAQTYVMLAPSLTNTAGTIADKSNTTLELGHQWEAFSMGLDIGRTTWSPVRGRDTTIYLELRPNLNVFQQGKFTNTLTTGIGYIFGAEMNLVTELTSGIEYAFTDQIHFNTYFGQYYYSGRYTADNATFFGVSVMYYFRPAGAGSLFGKKASRVVPGGK